MKRKNLILVIVLSVAMLLTTLPALPAAAAEVDRTSYRQYDHSTDELIAEAMRNRETEFIDDKYGLSMADFAMRVSYVYFTHPGIVGIRDISTFYVYNTGRPTSFQIQYVEDFDAYLQKLALVQAEVEALMPENPTQLEIVHILHDYLVSTSTFNVDAGKDKVTDYSVFYASGVFANRSAVCRGISHAYKYLLDLYGIDNAIAESTAFNHVWNLVRLDGEWYHVDCTADESAGYDNLGEVNHDYFLISTDTLLSRNATKSDFTVLYKDLDLVFTDSTCATDKRYEQGQPWSDAHTVCHYYKGDIYTMGTDSAIYKNGEFYYQPAEHMGWHPFGNIYAQYTGATVTAKLTAIGKDLYMNSPRNIYHLDLDAGTAEIVYSPEEVQPIPDPFTEDTYPSPNQIFGLNRMDGKLYIAIESDLPTADETWTYVPGFDVTYEIKEPETPTGLVDPKDKQLKSTVSVTADMGKELTVSFSGLQTGENLKIVSDNADIAKATASGGIITVKTGIDGTVALSVYRMAGNTVKGTYALNVTVNKNYTAVKDLTVTAGSALTYTDDSGDWSKSVNSALLDQSIATVTVTGVNNPGTPGTPGGFSKISTFAPGNYVIGYESGSTKYYLKASGSSLSAVTDKDQATSFAFAGSASGFTIKSGNYYLTHGSKLALSTSSSNSDWCFDSGKIYYNKKSISRTYKYYLRYSNKSFTVSNSTSAVAGAYSNQQATPAVPDEVYTKLAVNGLSAGKTYIQVGSTLYRITVERLIGTQEITVHTVDDAGVKLAEDYTISGQEGTAYYVQPTFRYGYLAPSTIVGNYTAEATGEVYLVYTLNTDKSDLKATLDAPISAALYTASSYQTYSAALAAGQTVYNKARATQVEVDDALAAISAAANGLVKKTFTVTVVCRDDAGVKIADDTALSGEINTGYTVTPKAISGYITPAAVSGTFTANTTVTLTYTLNTDKSALVAQLNNVVPQGDYTAESYTVYTNAIADGNTVNNNARATQAQVDAAVKAITEAKSALKVASKVAYVKDTDGIDSNVEYVLANNGKALAVVNGSITYVNVTEVDGGIGTVDDTAVWVLTKAGSSTYYLKNKATGKYLTTATSGSLFSRTYSLSLTTSKTTWTATKNGNYMRFAKSSRYITWSNGFGLTTSKSSNTDFTLYAKK